MELTSTENLILETAATLFGSPSEPPEWDAEANGTRPQLGDLLVAKGLLTQTQLDQVLDRVFVEIQTRSDRMAPPTPTPVPRIEPSSDGNGHAELGELVEKLAGILELLVGEGPVAGAVRRKPKPRHRAPPVGAQTIIDQLGSAIPNRDELEGAQTIMESGADAP